MLSRSLHAIEVSETGRLFAGSVLFPFLCTGLTMAHLKRRDTSPVSSERLRMSDSGSHTSAPRFLSTMEGMASGVSLVLLLDAAKKIFKIKRTDEKLSKIERTEIKSSSSLFEENTKFDGRPNGT